MTLKTLQHPDALATRSLPGHHGHTTLPAPARTAPLAGRRSLLRKTCGWLIAAATGSILSLMPMHPAQAADSLPDVATLLRKADAWRLQSGSVKVDTQVQTWRDDTLDKDKRYTVLLRTGTDSTRSLVLSRSPGEQGQKVLMVGEDFWILLPSSQRPLRITAMQKLLGEASTGDIATMSWSGDYAGRITGSVRVDGQPAWVLDLQAQRKGLSYQRIELTLMERDARPVQAALYTASDRKVKDARFEVGQLEGQPAVVRMVLIDGLQPGRRTVVSYLSRRSTDIPDAWFNPQFLSRNEVSP